MSVPRVVIIIRLEDALPRVYVGAVNDGEYIRLEDWLGQKPDLAGLVRLACELQNQGQAAA
jgi:hypothetical protein